MPRERPDMKDGGGTGARPEEALPKYQSLSDDEVIQNMMNNMAEREPEHAKCRTPRPGNVSHRRSKSLCVFELNEYTMGEIRRLHERLASRQPGAFRTRKSFFKDFDKVQKMALSSLCLVDFTSFCSMSIMAPFFPKEASMKGLSETTSGLVFSFYALVIFVSSPLIGKILPSVGAKFLFMAGLFVAGGCNLLFGLLGYIQEEWLFTTYCFLVRGLEALGASAYTTATYVFVVEVFPSNIGAVLGILETFVGLGMSTGPAIGGFLYSVGGFGLPFYTLGVILILTVPITVYLLPSIQGNSVGKKSGSFTEILTDPSVIIISLVIIISSNVWGFLDPTLEPHLRQFSLTPEKIGLIFLLFSALYGLSSPLWGYVSDKCDGHWFMMTSGLILSTIGLLLLGPAPFIPFLKNYLWLNLVALSILGVSVALALLPTFQGLLYAAVESGCRDELSTYSLVAGAWSCLYALGEVIGPLVGGIMTEHYGFPMCCTVMAGCTLTVAVASFIYFLVQDCSSGGRGKFRLDSFVDSGCGDSGSNGSSCDEANDETTALLQSKQYDLYCLNVVRGDPRGRKDAQLDSRSIKSFS
ncbi:UNVERIFIED_CONTAM: hypothetical protein PYX00_005926 [Menopon gallinae]|uniref:Major facilitator superfamily (MFS) profile domain-containing protein n=1 Tax=Menopon gallinae TaxID=328185 RepID=A0AAW2HVB9_9NEOP